MTQFNRQELVELIRRLLSGEGNDEQLGEWLMALKRGTGNPHCDIFDNPKLQGLTADEILDWLLEYRPLLMPPPSAQT